MYQARNLAGEKLQGIASWNTVLQERYKEFATQSTDSWPSATSGGTGFFIKDPSKRYERIIRGKLSPEIDRITVDQQGDGEVVIPMLESNIPAGYKVPIYEDLATAFNVTSYYKNCFTMRVRGDSMVDAGILDGDRVVIKRGHRFRNGDVIAAVVDGEITLKGVWTEDDRIHLVPANEKYPVYVVPEEASFECLGVCIDTFRPPRKVSKR